MPDTPHTLAVEFGRRLRATRTDRKVTQHALATELGVRETDVRRWETGRNLPHASMLPDIRRVLRVSIDDLFPLAEGEEEPKPTRRRGRRSSPRRTRARSTAAPEGAGRQAPGASARIP